MSISVEDRLSFTKAFAYRFNSANSGGGGGGGGPVLLSWQQNFATLYGGYAGNISNAPGTLWTEFNSDIQVNSVDGCVENGPLSNIAYDNWTDIIAPQELALMDLSQAFAITIDFSWIDPGSPLSTNHSIRFRLASDEAGNNNEINLFRNNQTSTLQFLCDTGALPNRMIKGASFEIPDGYSANTVHRLEINCNGAGTLCDVFVDDNLITDDRTMNGSVLVNKPRMLLTAVNADDGYRCKIHNIIIVGFSI